MQNFIEDYLDYFGVTEVPTLFDRWSCIAGLGAVLERNCYVVHGHNKIYPNQYIMLVGDSGSRKDTAINRIKKMVKKVGYKTIAADKTSKEKLLMDMEQGLDKISDPNYSLDVRAPTVSRGKTKNPTMAALFADVELSSDPTQCFIIAGELNAFLGHGNIEFIDLLTQLWDYDDVYESRIKTGRSVRVPFPTINLLGGNTNIGISMSFPTETIGQGLFSRLLMVYSDPSGRRITFPTGHDESGYLQLCEKLTKIKLSIRGEMKLDSGAMKALDDIYQNWKDLDDTRFKSYSTRRFAHLLKLCQIVAGASYSTTITTDNVIYANTTLHYTESLMPKALGEFGKARNSDISAKVLGIIERADKPLDLFIDIWPHVQRDLDSRKQLQEIIVGLKVAKKLDMVGGKIIPMKQIMDFNKFPNCQINLLREYKEIL
jgi:hypothetical protein